MNNIIQIDIKGYCNTGKTTIAALIYKTLQDNGFDCETSLLGNDSINEILSSDKFNHKLETIKNNSKIKITEINLRILSSNKK